MSDTFGNLELELKSFSKSKAMVGIIFQYSQLCLQIFMVTFKSAFLCLGRMYVM